MGSRPTAVVLGSRMVTMHTGAKDTNGRLVQFKQAPSWFRPVLTPREMLLAGMHGGIYFNPKGGKPGIKYPRSKYPKGIPGVTIDEFPREWFEDVPKELYLSRRYDTRHNRYKVKSGLDQAGWESSGWINECDPRGWTQWYFRFYAGRRLEGGEDERQMGRWKGVCGEKGRWKSNLVAKCLREGKEYDDASVSPVVRQTLLHWAYELTPADFASSTKRVQKKGAAYVPRETLQGVLTTKKRSRASNDDDDDDSSEELDEEGKAAARRQRANEAIDERQQRALRRADPATVASTRSGGAESSSSSAGTSSGRVSTRRGAEGAAARAAPSKAPSKRSRKAPKADDFASAPLSAYEIQRDEQRARNEQKLRELGLA